MNGLKRKMRPRGGLVCALLLALGLVLGACGGPGQETVPTGTETAAAAVSTAEGTSAETTEKTAAAAVSIADQISAETTAETADEVPARSSADGTAGGNITETADEISVERDGEYSDRDHVALYLHLYGELPSNYITKSDARGLGWDSGKGNLWDVAPGKSIGGDPFGNREGLLPEKKGRSYYECDIDYEGGYRGGERIVFSDDGLVYYSADHYENFELLYDEEGKAE